MENLKSSKIKLPNGMGGKYKCCKIHNIDTLNSPKNFLFKGKKYSGGYKNIVVKYV
jgi:hypothetical protein